MVFYTAASRLPLITGGTDDYKFIKIFAIGSLSYVALHYSLHVMREIEFINKYKNYLYIIMFVDLAFSFILMRFLSSEKKSNKSEINKKTEHLIDSDSSDENEESEDESLERQKRELRMKIEKMQRENMKNKKSETELFKKKSVKKSKESKEEKEMSKEETEGNDEPDIVEETKDKTEATDVSFPVYVKK